MAQFGVASLDDEELDKLKEPRRTWFDWGLAGFDRAEHTFNLLKRHIKYASGMRHLDVGCGPGYLSTCFASNGFESVGADLDDVSHADTNKRDFPDKKLKFCKIDCTKDEILELGAFDIITVDNVMEHVDSPAAVIARLKKILSKNGLVYLILPISRSIDLVRSDPHYRLFGITLLDKKDGDVMVRALTDRPSYEVNNCFHEYEVANYLAIFEKVGFDSLLCDGSGVPDSEADREYRRNAFLRFDLDGVKTSFRGEVSKLEKRLPEYLFDKLRYVIDLYLIELENDCALVNDVQHGRLVNVDPLYHRYFSSCVFFILKHASRRQ
jgi:SAM-dependent methyltransferase